MRWSHRRWVGLLRWFRPRRCIRSPSTAWRGGCHGAAPSCRLVNAALNGSFVYLTRGSFRVFGRVVKMTVLLGLTVALNTDRVRSSRSKHLETMVVAPILTRDPSTLPAPDSRAFREGKPGTQDPRPFTREELRFFNEKSRGQGVAWECLSSRVLGGDAAQRRGGPGDGPVHRHLVGLSCGCRPR